MKKIYLILSVLFISFGCGEDFTSINPKGVLADATLQHAGGVNLLLTSTYSALDGIYNGAGDPWFSTGDNWWFDVLSDDAHKGSEDSDLGQSPRYQYVSTPEGWTRHSDGKVSPPPGTTFTAQASAWPLPKR